MSNIYNSQANSQTKLCPHCQKQVYNYLTHVASCERRIQKERNQNNPIQLNNQGNMRQQQELQQSFQLRDPQQRTLSNQYSLNFQQIQQDNNLQRQSINNNDYQQPQPMQQDFHREERKYNDSRSNNNYNNNIYQNPNNPIQRDNGNMSYYHPINQNSQIFEEIKCPNCDTKLTLEMLSLHSETCQNIEVPCQFCNEYFPQCLIKDHLDVCEIAINHQRQESEMRRSVIQDRINNNQREPQQRQQQQQQQQYQRFSDVNPRSSNNRSDRQRQQQRMEQEMPFQRSGGNISSSEMFNPFSLLFGQPRSSRRVVVAPELMVLLNLFPPGNSQRQMQYLFQNGSMEGYDHSNNGGLSKNEMQIFPQHQFKKRPEMSQDQCNCTICMCEFEEGENVKILNCLHSYHSECIDEWLKKNTTCPVCKKDMQEFV